ncbi:MAG: winged helix-turn-helix domain-containing protein [Thermoanaerobaculia bacterium]
MLVGMSSPFGGQTRTRVLLALRLLGESYARELARLLDVPVNGVQQALRSLEKDGLVAARAVGRTRVFRIEPRYFAYDALQAYLLRLTAPERELQGRVGALRRRPRRTGKPL